MPLSCSQSRGSAAEIYGSDLSVSFHELQPQDSGNFVMLLPQPISTLQEFCLRKTSDAGGSRMRKLCRRNSQAFLATISTDGEAEGPKSCGNGLPVLRSLLRRIPGKLLVLPGCQWHSSDAECLSPAIHLTVFVCWCHGYSPNRKLSLSRSDLNSMIDTLTHSVSARSSVSASAVTACARVCRYSSESQWNLVTE